ncbi:fructose-bisphosphate aldolase class I [Candidatus Saccharibacteria bacterium]|nr:fructose-bisphosphate aldolase class I [Candidatus Saccharibacteria bacterium]
MNVLVVGSVIKDVYLNIDSRGENFEVDAEGVKWLDLGFNASEHHFFSQVDNYGGAAVTLEVLQRLGVEAKISGSELDFLREEDGRMGGDEQISHRYVLITDEQTCYLAPSRFQKATFSMPKEPTDYIFLDRSAVMTEVVERQIIEYLNNSPRTKLVIYAQNLLDRKWDRLLRRASLIFVENQDKIAANPDTPGKKTTEMKKTEFTRRLEEFDKRKLVFLSDRQVSYLDISEKISVRRVDVMTHLSAYSIVAGTVLGCFILGLSVEESLKLARLNVENAKLDSSLSLARLEEMMEAEKLGENLELTAASLVHGEKGILAADESGGSIHKKFEAMEIPDDYETRREYREMLITTEGLGEYVNGVILFDETARQRVGTGENFVDYLTRKMIMPGIKVDQGLEKMKESPNETYTKGLEGLGERLTEYHEMGLRFAKWRAAFNITMDENGGLMTPTKKAMVRNAEILAEYADECQKHGIVPIVEPEVVYDGEHSIETCARVTAEVLDVLFDELEKKKVKLEACILKVNMVLAGKKYGRESTAEEVGEKTAEVLKTHVPRELAGVVFLSGGQTPEQATENLAAVEKNGPFPWPVTFSFARALQGPALEKWAGKEENVAEAQEAFRERLIANSKALSM